MGTLTRTIPTLLVMLVAASLIPLSADAGPRDEKKEATRPSALDPECKAYVKKIYSRIKPWWRLSHRSGAASYEWNKLQPAKVRVKIGPDGELKGAEVVQSSGGRPFDEAALRAIDRAAPFPKPTCSSAKLFSSTGIILPFRPAKK